MILFVILGVICGIISGYLFYLWKRINDVVKYRTKLLDRIALQAEADIANQQPWRWRYDEFREVTFENMLDSFKALDSFYLRDPARPDR